MLNQKPDVPASSSPAVWIIGLAVALALGTVAWFLYQRSASEVEPEPVLTEEAKSYLSQLDLSEVEMVAREDALGQTLLEITGQITNNGPRSIALVEVNCVFRDVNGVEIDRQPAHVVRGGDLLEPGETQSFRLPFDNIVEGWNQTLPTLFVSQVQFAD